VTFDQAKRIGRPAYRDLEGGAVLRYDPDKGRIQYLPYPAAPWAWREAAFNQGRVPDSDWRHLAGCTCPACASTRVEEEHGA
jgi:hypothetical protein